MAERIIKVAPFDFLNFTEVRIQKNVNEHGSAEISGLLSSESTEDILLQHQLGNSAIVSAVDELGNEEILFHGFITDMSLESIGDSFTLHLHLVSHSVKVDQEKHTRTFQDPNMTYRDIFDLIGRDSEIGNYLVPEHYSNTIGKLFVQYEETDWQFAKRVASRLGTVVVSDFKLDEPYLSIGVPHTRQNTVIESSDYVVGSDYSESFHSPSYHSIFYTVTSREAYEIGTMVQFKGQKLFISKIETELVGARLVHTYTLRPPNGFVTHEFYNENLIGASLVGNVEEVEKDLVKVKIQKDVTQSAYLWFSYATVYSSPDDTGWYFMPEIGDEVRLHFPTQREWESYVISSVHLGGRGDADTKSFRTKWGKEIVFSPTSIYINNGSGSNILLDDEKGIKIATNKSVELTADKDITIDAVGKIDITGDNGVTISQADNVIDVDEVIDISAEYVRVE